MVGDRSRQEQPLSDCIEVEEGDAAEVGQKEKLAQIRMDPRKMLVARTRQGQTLTDHIEVEAVDAGEVAQKETLAQIRMAHRKILGARSRQRQALSDRILFAQEDGGGVEILLESEFLGSNYDTDDSEYNATASCTDDGSTSLNGDNSWVEDWDARSHESVTDESISSDDDMDVSIKSEEFWEDMSELFKLQWRDAWQVT
jgi:hypothetical protein